MHRTLKAILPFVALLGCTSTATAAKFFVTVKGVNGEETFVTDAEILVYAANGSLVNKGEITYDVMKKVYVVEIDEPRLIAANLSTVTLEIRAPKRASVKLDLLLGKQDQVIAVALPLMTVYGSTTPPAMSWAACGCPPSVTLLSTTIPCVAPAPTASTTSTIECICPSQENPPVCQPVTYHSRRHWLCHK